jgi:hypothetical protein
MMGNKFGVSSNGKLIIYDNNNKYNFVSITCNDNPVYTSYCFDSSSNVDGDNVKLLINGFMMKFVNDVLIYVIKFLIYLISFSIYIISIFNLFIDGLASNFT